MCLEHTQHINASRPFDAICASCQIYEHGRGLAFHFDKDEHLLSSKGQMVHPMVNSIVYLTGDSARSRLGAHSLHSISIGSLRPHGCLCESGHILAWTSPSLTPKRTETEFLLNI